MLNVRLFFQTSSLNVLNPILGLMVSIEITQRESILLANDVALLKTLYRFSIEDLIITSCIEIPLVYLYEDVLFVYIIQK